MIYRPRLTLISTRVAIVVVALLTGIGVLRHPGGAEFNTIWWIAVPTLGLAAVALLVLLGRPRLVATAYGLEVRNLVRTQRLEWNQVIAVRFGVSAPWVVLDLSDGSTLAVMAIAASDGARARLAAQSLATLVQRHSG